MKQNKNEIALLNQLLKQLYQTISQYDLYIMKAKEDEQIKSILQKIQKQHHEQIGHLVDLIQELEGNPVNSAGMNTRFKEFTLRLTLYNIQKILDQAMQDEERLIQALEQTKGNVSENIKVRIKDFIREMKAIVKRLYQAKMDVMKGKK
ncbi:MAG TPA: DUF2383 domain-containing protein [Haloplasmataceae bacterium]